MKKQIADWLRWLADKLASIDIRLEAPQYKRTADGRTIILRSLRSSYTVHVTDDVQRNEFELKYAKELLLRGFKAEDVVQFHYKSVERCSEIEVQAELHYYAYEG